MSQSLVCARQHAHSPDSGGFADGLLREDAAVEASAQNQAARAQACMTGLKSEMVMPVCVCGTTPRVRGLTVCASKELS